MNDPEPQRTEPASEFEREAQEQASGVWSEFFHFLRHSKKWWLLPILLLLMGLGVFLVLGGTAAAPWLYTLF